MLFQEATLLLEYMKSLAFKKFILNSINHPAHAGNLYGASSLFQFCCFCVLFAYCMVNGS